MDKTILKTALALSLIALGAGGASAFPGAPGPLGLGAPVIPAAMCGRTCERGGRYVPGPPEVCYDRGLEYCGSSREAPPPRPPAVVVPGLGLRIEGGGGGGYREEYRPRGENCRTITVERDDGTVRRIRRCD